MKKGYRSFCMQKNKIGEIPGFDPIPGISEYSAVPNGPRFEKCLQEIGGMECFKQVFPGNSTPAK